MTAREDEEYQRHLARIDRHASGPVYFDDDADTPAAPSDLSDPVDWPAPLDVFGRYIVPPLPPECLPESIERYVRDQSEIIGSDPSIMAVSCLVACSACITDAIKIQARLNDPTWQESARLWGAFVGDPSVKKTPPLNAAIKRIRKIDADWSEEADKQETAWKLASRMHEERERAHIRDSLKGAHGSLAGAPERPKSKRLVVDVITIEKLAPVLADNPRGLLLVKDELAEWFGSMDAYKGGKGGMDRAAWLQAYNGGYRKIDRVTSGSVRVPNWSVCMLGGIQPERLKQIMKDAEEDGLLQRFMIVIASEQEGIGIDRAPDAAAYKGYREIIDRLIDFGTANGEPVRMTPEAAAIRETLEIELKNLRKVDSLSLPLRSHFGKLDGIFVRLCLTYACIDQAAKGFYTPNRVTGATAERVRRFVMDYLIYHLHAFYMSHIGSGEVFPHVQGVANLLISKSLQQIDSRTIHQLYKPWRVLPQPRRTETTDLLVQLGWLRPATTAGLRVTRWTVNPRVHEDFKDRAEADRLIRSELVKKIHFDRLKRLDLKNLE